VSSVFERDRKLLEYLDRAGIKPGVEVEVVAALEDVHVAAAGKKSRVKRAAASKVWARSC
jgi:hypothetical protein